MPIRGLAIGEGAAEVLARSEHLEVLASFSRALYLAGDGGILALVPRTVFSGPVHVTVDVPDLGVFSAVRSGEQIEGVAEGVAEGVMVVGGREVVVDSARRWVGELPEPKALRGNRELFNEAVADLIRGSDLWSGNKGRWWDALAERSWSSLTDRLVGLGRGLTPAGDDVLAGVFLVARALGVDVPAPDWERVSLRTTRLSVPFLQWAHRGSAISPVHDLLVAAASEDRAGCDDAVEKLGRVGASSGADIAVGLLGGLAAL